ncbi:MAG TPA: hypothetical protein VI790_05895 [Candidatus Nanoarchaeia archaeon]|nr:hypothetical protein [Candidatus Nanoarchaeia archaeon]
MGLNEYFTNKKSLDSRGLNNSFDDLLNNTTKNLSPIAGEITNKNDKILVDIYRGEPAIVSNINQDAGRWWTTDADYAMNFTKGYGQLFHGLIDKSILDSYPKIDRYQLTWDDIKTIKIIEVRQITE